MAAAGNIGTNNFDFRKLEKNNLGSESRWLGLRQKLDKFANHYYIHCIFGNRGDHSVSYLKVSPTNGDSFRYQKFKSSKGNFWVYEAAFIGSAMGSVG